MGDERFDTVVIGAGQAGLAIGHYWPGSVVTSSSSMRATGSGSRGMRGGTRCDGSLRRTSRICRVCGFRARAVACHGEGTTASPGAWDQACPVAGRVVMVA